jgi:Flp pilus assembly protein TadG
VSRSERGAAAVEFALVLPLLVLLIAGIAEFGRLYYLQTTISGAAREGVRTMALQNNAPAARTAAKTAAGPVALTDAQVVVTTLPLGPCLSTGTTPVTATVTITYSTALMSGFFGANKSLTGKGVMRCGG